MAKKTRTKRDEILEDIESALQERIQQPGYVMTIHPDGTIQIVTGAMRTEIPVRLGNPHYSCCCSDG